MSGSGSLVLWREEVAGVEVSTCTVAAHQLAGLVGQLPIIIIVVAARRAVITVLLWAHVCGGPVVQASLTLAWAQLHHNHSPRVKTSSQHQAAHKRAQDVPISTTTWHYAHSVLHRSSARRP